MVCSPATFRITRPERDVCEDNNRRVRAKVFHVALEPFQLLVAELTQAAGLKVKDVDQCNEMDTILIETVIARAFAFDALQITFTVKLSAIVKHIVLSGNIENVLGPAALEHFIEGVELFSL